MARGTLIEVQFANGKSRGTIKPVAGGQVDFYDFPGKLAYGAKVDFAAYSHKEMSSIPFGQQRPVAKELNGVGLMIPKSLKKVRNI
ncbi:MAG: hypothetical protein Q7R76_03605 [Candidatus Woesearchaeota archaeon]|nr:hypothetical protein [Candidatus Woesearchaeota archaeon]